MAVNAVLYLVPNHLQLVTPYTLWWTRVDAATPFLPATVWIYFSDYLLVSSAFLVSEGWDEVRRFVRAYFVLLAIGAAIHLAWPTVFPRQAFPVPDSGLSARALTALRGVDLATSCLPSMHVAARTSRRSRSGIAAARCSAPTCCGRPRSRCPRSPPSSTTSWTW